MTRKLQYENWIARILRRARSTAPALAVVLPSIIMVPPPAQAQTFTVLHRFRNGKDGSLPFGGLVRDAAGGLYGTTVHGGDHIACTDDLGCGTVFKVSPTGKEKVLYRFTGLDGLYPEARLIRDAAGNLYGTTLAGGTHGDGTVFKLDTAGNETVLHSFAGGDEGGSPYAGLIRDAAGNLYGTTPGGGDIASGTIFKVDTSGEETMLHSFTGFDGRAPRAGLIRDATGNLYGTTAAGGDFTCDPNNGCGAVFKLDAHGNETVLHAFTGPDGRAPWAGLVRDSAGNLYGTTIWGGDLTCTPPYGCGTVFKVDTTGNETVLYSFTGGIDGSNPLAGLVMDSVGNLYGTTDSGGDLACNAPNGCGTVFKLDTFGNETVLHSFTGGTEGSNPNAGLVQDAAGNFYGTTVFGGDRGCHNGQGCGTVFKLTP